MVTFKNQGRFGNFLFQAATAMAYAWEHGLEFTVPAATKDPKWNPIYFPHLINSKFNPALPFVTVTEQAFTYQKLPVPPQLWKGCNIVLEGYWQSEKYFALWREEVLRHFSIPWKPKEGVVSVHVRRTDYLTIRKGGTFKHPAVSVEWIQAQMRKFPDHLFAVFSDDIDWCKRHLKGPCIFSEARTELQDLEEMQNCQHHICSASTFSWWGSWLGEAHNPKSRIILPKHWFSAGWGGLDTADIVPERWERA